MHYKNSRDQYQPCIGREYVFVAAAKYSHQNHHIGIKIRYGLIVDLVLV